MLERVSDTKQLDPSSEVREHDDARHQWFFSRLLTLVLACETHELFALASTIDERTNEAARHSKGATALPTLPKAERSHLLSRDPSR